MKFSSVPAPAESSVRLLELFGLVELLQDVIGFEDALWHYGEVMHEAADDDDARMRRRAQFRGS